MKAVDAATFYAFGPGTLLRSADAGQTWQAKPRGRDDHRHQLRHARPLPVHHRPGRPPAANRERRGQHGVDHRLHRAAVRRRIRERRPARSPPAAAARPPSPTTADATTRPVGGDIAGSFQFGLRLGPAPNIALALGARGQLARTTDNGVTWKAINVATSSDMRDTSFSSADDGYALDVRGGLFRTVNGGASWQPIDPGTTQRAAGRDHERGHRAARRPARHPARRRRRPVQRRRQPRPRGPLRPRRIGDLRLRLGRHRAQHEPGPRVAHRQAPGPHSATSR